MLGMWAVDPSPEAPPEMLAATGADLMVTSLRQAVRQIIEEGSPEQPEVAPESRTTAA
jgi:hypothetical protein